MDSILASLFICLIFVSCSSADRRNPLKDPKICGRPQCDLETSKFAYKQLVRYKYNYRSHVRTEFHGTGQNTSDIFVTAAVQLTFPKKCEGLLEVTEIELRNAPLPELNDDGNGGSYDDNFNSDNPFADLNQKSSEFASEIQRYAMRFAFHDGVIGELCPDVSETNWVINFKRGILSALQNSMKRLDIDHNTKETDISGICDVNYVVNGASQTSLLIRKHKDISSCQNRYKTNSILQTTPYEFRKHYTAWPVLQSTSYCNITVDHHIYKEVVCFEHHQLVPFSNNASGATTTSSIKLSLAEEEEYEIMSASGYDEEEPIKKRETLLFNHFPTPKPTTGEIRASRELLQKMCKLGFPDIKRQFIDVFSKFLHTAKFLSSSALHQLLARASSICSDSRTGKNHILESLPYIGSAASVKMMISEIIKQSVTPEIMQKWLSSMSFLPRPDEEMLESLYQLLEFADHKPDAMIVLTPTAVVHTFCRLHFDCAENEKVQHFLHRLEESIQKSLESNLLKRTNREKIIVLLKGLGNIGILSKPFQSRMRKIIENDNIPTEIRVHAVAVHRRGDCARNRDFFIDVYRNFTANSEVRIAAYLEAMRCPDYISMKHIKFVLKNEEVNQVGSFVWSHLKNTAKSASPVRVEAQGLLVDDDLGTKYRMDLRKFSQNFERSIFFDEYNLGASGDSNLIFATDSYFPRSVSMNFTVDLFGESINIFEVNAYMQGFEHMVEGLFGPKGPLSTEGFTKKLDAATQYVKDKITPLKTEYIDNLSLRLRREANEEKEDDIDDVEEETYEFENEDSDRPRTKRNNVHEDEIQKDVNDLNYKVKYDMNSPRAAFGLKMFGNDINHKTLEGMNEISALLLQLNPSAQIQRLLSGQEIIYTKSGVFLEASYEVPLSSGFPLAVQAYGASSIDLRMQGSLKGDRFWPNPHFDIKGKLKPSISLDVTTTMQSDYFFGSAGVRVKSNLYSSTSVEANLTVNGLNYVSLQFGLPQDRNDIISAKSDLYVLQYDSEIRQRGIRKRYANSTCTWPAIERAVGLKVCSNYSLPDVSHSDTPLPSLLLCGPINVNIHIDKADLTAKSFLFEYKWVDQANRSTGRFVFETPHTAVSRIFVANITRDPDIYNLSMSFVNGATEHWAIATYKNTEEEKLIEAHIHMDGQQSFALEMGMNRSEIKHGFIYYPRFTLAVANDQIAGLSGDVKMVDKRNIVQYDTNLNFATKKFETGLKGFILKTDLKYTTRLVLNYQFKNSTMEYIELDSEFGKKSDKVSGTYTGMVKWNSTAYAKYNFATDFKYTQVLGHIDLMVNVNNAVDFVDPRYNLGVHMIIVLASEDKDYIARSMASLEIVRPISRLDYKFLIKHESKYKNGLVHNFLFLIRYAKDKEATAVVSAMLPSAYLRNTDVYVNVTVPSFGSCTVHVKATEQKSNQYFLRLHGAWFTGQSIKIDGIYEDKSTLSEASHYLKLIVRSPHFNETNIVAIYIFNDTGLVVDTRVQYGIDPYGLVLKHTHVSLDEQSVYGEVKVRQRLYTLSANLNNKISKRISIDLHIDGVRDIQIILRGHSTALRKETGIEIKWDANRDDTQKLVLTGDFNTPRHKVYDGGFTFSYPDRTFSGSFDLSIPGPFYRGNVSIGWSANDAIDFSFDSGTILNATKTIWLISHLRTPFEGWHHNAFDSHLVYARNYLSTNASVLWANKQRLGLGLLTDFDWTDPNVRLESKLFVNSTVKDVPTIDAFFKHTQNLSNYDTDVSLRHTIYNEKPNVYAVKSNWQLHLSELHRNISGSVALRSPTKGYTKGALVTKFSLSSKKMLHGAADVELEGRKFTLAVAGTVKKITNCMLEMNVTTPIEKYRNIKGRFGLIDRNRHIVAELRAPNAALGIEIKFAVQAINDFDIIFNVETPIASLEKAMLVAKLHSDVIDFRGGLNKFVLGYVAVSRKVSLQDFEYSWKVYTPLPKFEESSLVVKYVQRKMVDLEVMLKFAAKKLGVVIDGKPKQKFIRLPRISSFQFESRLADEFDRFSSHFAALNGDGDASDSSSGESSEEDAVSAEDDWNIAGHMELDTIVWPTISGNLDIEDIAGEDYIVSGNLILPLGTIEFRDQLYFPDYMNVQNSLRVISPYAAVGEIELLYSHTVEFGQYYISALELFYKNDSRWIELGYTSNYTKQTDDADLKTHEIDVNFLLPFETLPRISFAGSLELEETVMRANVSGRTIDTYLSLAGSVENDVNFIDVNVGLKIDAPLVPNYGLKVFFKRDLSDIENMIDVGFEENQNGTSKARMESVWHIESSNYVKFNSKFSTNVFPLAAVETSVFLNRTANLQAALDLSYVSYTRRSAAFHASITRRNEQLNVEVQTPMADYANITMIGSLSPISRQSGRYNLAGKLYRNHEIYNVDGTMTITSDFPVEVDLQLKPVSRNAIGFLTYSLRNSGVGYGKSLQFKVMEGNTYFEVMGSLNIYSKLNWNLEGSINTSPGLLSRKLDHNRCELKASLRPDNSGRLITMSRLQTPWRQLGIDLVTMNGSASIAGHTGDARVAYDFSLTNGTVQCAWTFVMFENMNVLLDIVSNRIESEPKSLGIGIRYVNPGRNSQRMTFGGSFAIDSKWRLETNGSVVAINKNDISGNLALRLPEPLADVHRFSGHFDGDLLASPLKSFMCEANYESEKTRKRFLSRAQYRNVTDLQALLRAQWGLDTKLDTFESNLQMLRKGRRREVSAKVQTPLYKEDTITASGSYDDVDSYHLMSGTINYPASHQIANTDIKFSSISNLNGFLNCSTPFKALNWLQTDLNYTTTGGFSRRFIKAQWPRDYAIFDLQNAFESRNLDRDHHGTVAVEVPLATRHTANIEYGLKERNQLTTGHCNVIYNTANILNGQYVCKSESRAGFNKDSISITLENRLRPLGIVYVHQAEQSGPDPPFYDMKRAEIYELHNSSRFNITGELHIRTTMTGHAYKILAVHPNRTVVITSDYDYQEATTRHRSKLQLAQEIWIAYDLKLQNLTTHLNDSQNIDLTLSYPKRNLSTSGWYGITEEVFDADFEFKWTIDKNANSDSSSENNYDDYGEREDEPKAKRVVESEERIVRGALKWQNEPLKNNDRSNQTILLTLRHPFEQDVTFNVNYYRSDIDLVRGKIVIDYNGKPDHLVTFEAGLRDYKPIIGYRNYTLHAFGHHEKSEFDLNALASVAARPGIYETKNFGMYRRNVVPLDNSLLNAGINLLRNEVHYRKVSAQKTFYVWMQADGEYPLYTWNATLEDSPDVNTTAEFFVNIDGRLVRLDANFTPDASQNLRMFGNVPDARSASFNLWRDYEDIRIVDISYYLRMNHSRLITSQLIWRPKLKKEIMEKFQLTAKQFYDTFSENIDFWVKKLYSESTETINDIWLNARPDAEQFLTDISGLRVIEDDFDEFRKFLNQSYESNDFYVKTVVNFTLNVLDELAIRNHIGTVPKILNEIWQMLGDSGAAFRKNILWLIETIKTSYKNAVEVLTRIFHGEAMSYVSVLVEKAVDSYDKIVKELHLNFIKYVQNIWNRVSDSLTDYWRKLLDRIQPTIMKFIHYAESVLWRISQELFEFLHKRTNEIVESPYYDKISKFTQDMDRIYRDIQTNDALTNIRKYTSLVWDFLQEKYFEVVPFAKELQNITNELSDEIWQLQKQEPVQFVLIRVNEWKQKFAWFAEEFQLDRRAQQLWQIVINKITAYEQTALQSDDKYREAKTYFVFDPDTGLMKLEQKLPMSWHAFNETPLFEEIAEFKMVGKAFRLFNGVNVTLVNPFEQLQYYTNPHMWLPPFKSRSILVGSRHYITFDKQIISLNRHKYAIIEGHDDKPDKCSYLLAHDFVDSNFTLIQEPATNSYRGQLLATRKLALAVDENVFDVDMVGGSIRINRNQTSTLPIQIGDTVIYRDTDILVVRSNNGFQLNCNLQFDFCWFELSGWYYGKTAGLLGTMNNEIFDDSLASNHVITQDPIELKNSWALKQCKTQDDDDEDASLRVKPSSVSNELLNICDTFFRSKISQFANCFAVVDSLPFYDMCLDMGTNSISNFTEENHPAQKGSCAVALAYIETCTDENVPLRVPDVCVHCDLNNGSYVAEGKIFDLKDNDVPLTTDIVFIVEAKPCNRNLNRNKSLLAVLSSLNKQLNESNFTDNRFAVVAFGGDAPFDRPNSIVYRNQIFSDANNIRHYIDHIRTGNGSQTTDVSHAIKVASDLVFRPGASKTFILLPCSLCNVSDMRFDYSSIHQTLIESNINLHILMDGDIEMKKPRNEHKLFGFDRDLAYTNKYLKDSQGEKELRTEVVLPKQKLGTCLALAMISDGSVFTANKLRPGTKTSIKKFTAVFAKRVVKTAVPSACQTCECTGHNTGIAYISCTKCEFPISASDYNLEEDYDMKTKYDDLDFSWGDDF